MSSIYPSANPSTLPLDQPLGEEGLVGFWSFEEGTGSLLRDISGNSYNGTLINNPTWTSAPLGFSLDFDGVDDRVDMGDVLDFDRFDPFTFSFILKRDGTGGVQTVLEKTQVTDARGYIATFVLDKFSLFFSNDNSPSNRIVVEESVANTSTAWQHLVITYDGSSNANGVSIYRNGSPLALSINNNNLGGTTINTGSLKVGDRTVISQPLNGKVADIRIFNRFLTQDQVKGLFNELKVKLP